MPKRTLTDEEINDLLHQSDVEDQDELSESEEISCVLADTIAPLNTDSGQSDNEGTSQVYAIRKKELTRNRPVHSLDTALDAKNYDNPASVSKTHEIEYMKKTKNNTEKKIACMYHMPSTLTLQAAVHVTS